MLACQIGRLWSIAAGCDTHQGRDFCVCVQQQYRSHTSIPILFSPSQCFSPFCRNAFRDIQRAIWQEILREQVERLGVTQLAGIAQDSARVCTKAWRLLQQDLQAMQGFERVTYITCGERIGQLINQDLAKIHPWLQDRPLA